MSEVAEDEFDHLIGASKDETIIPTESVDKFFAYLVAWHQEKLTLINQMRIVPEGTKLQIKGKPTVFLEGEAMQAFQYGVDFVLANLGSLPFVAELEDRKPANEPESKTG